MTTIVTQEQEAILHRITDPQRLVIARVPIDVKERFVRIANEQFCGDYGMVLKWLVDGLLTAQQEQLQEQLDQLQSRIQHLEQEQTTPTKEIRLANGRRIVRSTS